MGGYGSGRTRSYAGKKTTERSVGLDIRRLARCGHLVSGKNSTQTWSWRESIVASIDCKCLGDRVVLRYTYTRGTESAAVEQEICILRTPCNYGGDRAWWQCPACDRRVAILYSAGKYFACRHCCGLCYASQKEDAAARSLRRILKIRERLGQTTEVRPILRAI
jgi:hypothetical protein